MQVKPLPLILDADVTHKEEPRNSTFDVSNHNVASGQR